MTNSTHLDDEFLSAILDGEAPASGHLDDCAHCSRRLRDLGDARDTLAADHEPLDEMTRARMIRAALAADDESAAGGAASGTAGRIRRRPWLVAAGAAAAVAVVVAAVGAAGRTRHPNATTSLAAPTLRDAGALGDLSSADALRHAIAALDAGTGTVGFRTKSGAALDRAGDAQATSQSQLQADSTASPGAASAGGSTAEPAEAAAAPAPLRTADISPPAPAAIDRCARIVARDQRPGRYTVRAWGEMAGKPVAVVGFEATVHGKLRRRIFVTDPQSCDVLQFAAR